MWSNYYKLPLEALYLRHFMIIMLQLSPEHSAYAALSCPSPTRDRIFLASYKATGQVLVEIGHPTTSSGEMAAALIII